MVENLREKAKNYFILGVIAENLNMNSESATNYLKSLFAIADSLILEIKNLKPKDHAERFNLLKLYFPKIYAITDSTFNTYRRTYTQELNKEELKIVKKRLIEAFENAKINIPTNEEIKRRFEEFIKKGKIFS